MFKTRRIATDNEFFSLHEEWNKLVDESECQSIFLTWDWLFTWWRHFRAAKKLFIIEVRDENDRLIGLGPFYIQKNRLRIKCVHFLGSDKMAASDLLDMIVYPENSRVIRQEIFLFLQQHCALWDVLVISDVDERSSSISEMLSLADQFNWYRRTYPKEICPVIHLPADYELFIAHLGSRSRRNIRNFRKRLSEQHGVSYDKLNGTNPVQTMVAALNSLHLQRYEQHSKYTSFQHKKFRDFQLDAAQKLSFTNRVTFHALRQQEKMVAMCFFLIYKNQLFLYQGGFDDRLVPKNLSIMLVLLDFCIQDAIALGIQKIHLLRGTSNFKSQFTATYVRTKSIILGRNMKYFAYLSALKMKSYVINNAKKLLPQRSWDNLKIRLIRMPTS